MIKLESTLDYRLNILKFFILLNEEKRLINFQYLLYLLFQQPEDHLLLSKLKSLFYSYTDYINLCNIENITDLEYIYDSNYNEYFIFFQNNFNENIEKIFNFVRM